MTNYKNLVNNMPILYMQEEVLAVKMAFRRTDLPQCERILRKTFSCKEEVVGKKSE